MRALLGESQLLLESDVPQVRATWALLFDRELALAADTPAVQADLRLIAASADALPPLPVGTPFYRGPDPFQPARQIRFDCTAAGGILTQGREVQITFDFDQQAAAILITTDYLHTSSIEDITLAALAPLLRRQGWVMTHAFAVAAGESAVLLCGPSGSGKTTTGLALLQAGWRYLANDCALLRKQGEVVFVAPSPGLLNVHPASLTFLPAFQSRMADALVKSGDKLVYSRGLLLEPTSFPPADKPLPVSAILFPRLVDDGAARLDVLPAGIATARLLTEDVDRWDEETFLAHIDLLAALGNQAVGYEVHLPRSSAQGLAQLPSLLANLISL